jgi:Domain of unknown function (DUF222)
MVRAGLAFLAAADATAIAADEQARVLQELEQGDAVAMAARAAFLAAFTAGQGYSADADYSARAWLIHKTGVTRGAAAGHTAWAKRLATHPQVVAALARREVSESLGRMICRWTDKLPEDRREVSDRFLADAAAGGLGLQDLAALFAEMYERCRGELPDEDPARGPGDRGVRLETTFQGAGVLAGDLTPECAAVVGAVLDALSAPAGAEDTRTKAQRYHDALAEAMRRLVATDLLPERAGQPVRALVHVDLGDLMKLEGSSALLEQWAARVHAVWAARRAAASQGGGDGGAWLDGQAARTVSCDASLTPVVTGEVNLDALDGLVRLCVQLGGLHRHCDSTGGDGGGTATGQGAPAPDGSPSPDALVQAIIGRAVALLSGPGGLAGFLRRRQLGARLGGPSLPLDVGVASDIPTAIRRAVILRDQHCRFPNRCDQPAAACEVHHLTHKADGGKTGVTDCALFCTFHHQVVIHQWGWTVVLNPDGTTTAWNKDKTKILHSHGPPARPG